jgi:tetratricopeptide (TPR) repeat protein
MRINKFFVVITLTCLVATGCTKPGETTAIGATTGGVIGAGVGAVVGGQSGDPFAGAAIGAVAGALAGGAVGNALEAHEEVMQRQDEALERQQRIISSQESEIRELRRLGQDTITYKSPTESSYRRSYEERASSKIDLVIPPSLANKKFNGAATPGVWRQKNIGSPAIVVPSSTKPVNAVATNTKSVVASSQATAVPKTEVKPIVSTKIVEPIQKVQQPEKMNSISEVAAINQTAEVSLMSDDCKKAEQEISQSETQEDASDKLFHLRRALRLCPDNSGYHKKLGDLYLSLNRKDDAKYEFGEAVRLDPNSAEAKSKLNELNKY